MTLQEMADALGLRSTGSLRTAVRRGILRAERVGKRTLIVAAEEVERYRREHLGKRGFLSPDHPYHGQRPPRKGDRAASMPPRDDDP